MRSSVQSKTLLGMKTGNHIQEDKMKITSAFQGSQEW